MTLIVAAGYPSLFWANEQRNRRRSDLVRLRLGGGRCSTFQFNLLFSGSDSFRSNRCRLWSDGRVLTPSLGYQRVLSTKSRRCDSFNHGALDYGVKRGRAPRIRWTVARRSFDQRPHTEHDSRSPSRSPLGAVPPVFGVVARGSDSADSTP